MALMQLKVTLDGGDVVAVKVTPKAVVAAERHFKKGMGDLFGQSVTYEALAWVAWQAMQLSGHVVKTFDLWLDGVEAIEAVDDAAPL
jgi:hypothetical protein